MSERTAEQMERERIALLERRDGEAAARAWVERTLGVYREAIDSPASHASVAQYRPHFEASIHAFEAWLARRAR